MNKKDEIDERVELVSSPNDSEEKKVRRLLDEASDVAERVLRTIQALAGTTIVKGVQIANLERYAIENGYWIEDVNKLGVFSDRGSENEVYLSLKNNNIVYKLNDFRYADDNLSPFFERLRAHNLYFPECHYELIGFAKNQADKICAVLSQPFIVAVREATELEIKEELQRMGFIAKLNDEYFSNDVHDIFDAVPNNVLIGKDGHLYFIDTIIFKNQEKGFEKYKSLSPRYNGEM